MMAQGCLEKAVSGFAKGEGCGQILYNGPQKWVILYPVLLLTKPKAGSGQIQFVHVIVTGDKIARARNKSSILDVLNNKII